MDKGEAEVYAAAEIMKGIVLSDDRSAYDAYRNHCEQEKKGDSYKV